MQVGFEQKLFKNLWLLKLDLVERMRTFCNLLAQDADNILEKKLGLFNWGDLCPVGRVVVL